MKNTKHSATCQAATKEIDDDAPRIFGTTAYVPCGKPAAWTVDTGKREYDACEDCVRDALLYEGARWVTDRDGNDVSVDEDYGDLRVAS